MANIMQKSLKYPDLPDTYMFLQLDTTSSKKGEAAEAKQFGDFRKAFDYVTPEQYGAKGDGTTDDTTAFNSALAAGSYLYLGNGHYYINGTVTLSAHQKIVGNSEYQYDSKARIIMGANGYIHTVGAANVIRHVNFVGKDATGTISSYQPKAIVADPATSSYDVDLTIDDCIFYGFVTPVTVNGRGLYLRRNLFTFYTTAVKLNYVANGNGALESDKNYGGRAFVIEDNRFHSNSGESAESNCVLIASGSTAYGLIFSRNLCDANFGRLYCEGVLRDSVISDNVFLFPPTLTGARGVQIDGYAKNITINGNVFDAESRHNFNIATNLQEDLLPERWIAFASIADGITISDNKFCFAEKEAILFGGYCVNGNISDNEFSALCFSDSSVGKAVDFQGVVSNTIISDNVYYDTQYAGKTNSRYFCNFAYPAEYTKLIGNLIIKGGTATVSAITDSSASHTQDGTRLTVTQSANYGYSSISFGGLTASTKYTVSFILADKNADYNALYVLNNDGANSGWVNASTVGRITVSATSSANGNLYLMLRPSGASNVKTSIVIDQLRIQQGSDAEDAVLKQCPDNFSNGIGCIVDTVKLKAYDDMMQYTEIRLPGTSLFDGTGYTDNYAIQISNGAAVSNNSCFVTDFIPVAEGYVYSVNQSISSSSLGMAFYDSTKTFISGVASNFTPPKLMTAPAGAAYIRCTALKANVSTFKLLVAGMPS